MLTSLEDSGFAVEKVVRNAGSEPSDRLGKAFDWRI